MIFNTDYTVTLDENQVTFIERMLKEYVNHRPVPDDFSFLALEFTLAKSKGYFTPFMLNRIKDAYIYLSMICFDNSFFIDYYEFVNNIDRIWSEFLNLVKG